MTREEIEHINDLARAVVALGARVAALEAEINRLPHKQQPATPAPQRSHRFANRGQQ